MEINYKSLTDSEIKSLYIKHLKDACIRLDAAALTLSLYKDENVEFMQKKLYRISSKLMKFIKQMDE